MLNLAYFLLVLTLKSSFSTCWNRSLGGGRDFRGFRGRERPNHRDSPKRPGEGRIRSRFLGRGRGRSWEGAGSGNLLWPHESLVCLSSLENFVRWLRINVDSASGVGLFRNPDESWAMISTPVGAVGAMNFGPVEGNL